ncbi:MAG: FtsX-like permease family protein [Streptosporangiaceae bacterium]|nr:FtsX-like permease family protein [Streptosporangiaceae bacterium]MBV9856654.1 FtsX-like permease family protein [Streptosporangiaceae bacterium]
MRATLRWARADLRARRGQAILTAGVVAGLVAALVLATMLLEGTTNPWRGLFTRSHGADVLVYLTHGTRASELSSLPGVQQVAGPYQTASATLEQGAVRSHVELRAMTPALPQMSTPLIVAGTWLRAPVRDGVVVEASFAAATHVGVGDLIKVEGIDGTTVSVRIVGIADTADQGFYPQWTPGLIWVQPGTLAKVEPDPSETQEVVGLRLANPSVLGTSQAVEEVYGTIGNPVSTIERVSTWLEVRNSMASDDRLLGLLLALFGIIALVAAPCAIANVTAGRVLVQRQDMAMLKALGFTPGQVVRMLLAEQTALGIAGTALGLAAALALAEFVRLPDGTPVTLAPLPGSWVALIAVGTVGTVAIATAIPAWRAGTVSPVAAVAPSPPRGRLSLIARLSLLVRLPAPLVLGVRDSFTRRLPAALTVLGVAIPMVMITIALSCWSTIDGFTREPGKIGLAAALTASPGLLTPQRAAGYIAASRNIAASYPGAEFDALLPGGSNTITARGMGYSYHPYPFDIVQGRMFSASNEAVAGQGLLGLLHLQVGSWTWLTIDGVPVIFHIVGRAIDPVNNGDVLDFGLDALRALGVSSPQFYSLVLRPGVSPGTVRAQLLAASRGGLDVQAAANPAGGLWIVRVVIAVSVPVLAIIGLANLLTATAIGLRDHQHEVGVLKALGLTPRQVTATLVINATLLTAIGGAAGTLAGFAIAPWLIDMQGKASGMGAGIASRPSALMIAGIAVITLGVATAAALLLARGTPREPGRWSRGYRGPAWAAAPPVFR